MFHGNEKARETLFVSQRVNAHLSGEFVTRETFSEYRHFP